MLKKEEMRRWLKDRLQTQDRLVIGALVGMVVIGLIATSMEFVVFYLIIRIGFISSGVLAVLATLAILASIQLLTLMLVSKQLPDGVHEAELDEGVVEFRLAPNMTAVWTYAFGSLESDRSWVEILLGVLSLPQRMCAAAWFSWQRRNELQNVSVESCAMIIRLLHKEAERVELKKIIEEITIADVAKTLRELSLIDGVVFLTRNGVGLSLATRLVDDLHAWKEKHGSTRQDDRPV